MRVRYLISFILTILLYPVFSQVYLVEIYNPNPYDLHDFQVKINATSLNLPLPIASIQTLDGSNIPFCYEQPNLECNETYQNTTGIIWAKIPYIPAKRYTFIKVIVNYSNGAVHGDQVFDFYDDFLSDTLDNYVYSAGVGGSIVVGAGNWTIHDGLLIGEWDAILDIIVNPSIYRGRDYSVETRLISIKRSGSSTSMENAGVIFRATDINNLWLYKCHQTGQVILFKKTNGKYNQVTSGSCQWVSGWHIQRVVVLGSSAYYYINNRLVHSYKNINTPQGSVGIETWNSVVKIDWIRVRKYADQDPRAIASFPATEQINTPQKQETEYQFNYLYVLPLDIISNKFVSQTYTTLPIIVNTQKFISDGIMKSDCSDIAITLYNPTTDTEQDLPFWLDPATCNTPNTVIYVKLPVYAISQDSKLFIYFGAPNSVPMSSPNAFYYFVDFSNPSDYSKIEIYTDGTASYNITSNGIKISIGTNGQLVIYNK